MNESMNEPSAEPVQESPSFTAVAERLNENMASAVLRLVDATQDFTSLIRSFVSAGEALERSLAIHRELGAASQKALEDAREAARAASASAAEASEARINAHDLVTHAAEEYGTVSELVDNMQQRIAALSVLAAPMPRSHIDEPVHLSDGDHSEADKSLEDEGIATMRAS
jgi:hypothetical protein